MENRALAIKKEPQTASLMQCIQTKDSIVIALYERSLTLDVAINAKNVTSLILAHGEKDVLTAAMDIILATSAYFNVGGNLTPQQAIQIASLFISEYKLESLEDLMLCMKKLKLGTYGKIYRIDGEILFNCFNEYLGEKYERFEQLKHNEKVKHDTQTQDDYMVFAAKIIEEKQKKEVPETKTTSATLQLTDKSHFEAFKKLVTKFNLYELNEMERYYKLNNMPVQGAIIPGSPITIGHLDHYIEVIQSAKQSLTRKNNDTPIHHPITEPDN